MSITTTDAAETAYKLGQAYSHLKKVQKIFAELKVSMGTQVEDNVYELLSFCNEKVLEIKENGLS